MIHTGFVVDLHDPWASNCASDGTHLEPTQTDSFDKVTGFTISEMEQALIQVEKRGNRDIRTCGFDWWRYYIAGHNHCAWELYKYWDSWDPMFIIIGNTKIGRYVYRVRADSPCRDNGYVATAARQTTSTSDTGWICGGIVGNENGEEDSAEERLTIPQCPPPPPIPRRSGCSSH